MPTYEYRCPDGHDFEHFVQKISEASATLPCPACGKEAQRRISAGGGLVFKGSGFYITDYGKDGKKADREKKAAVTNTKPDAPKSDTAAKGDTAAKSDAPAAKSDAKPADSSAKPPTPGSGNEK